MRSGEASAHARAPGSTCWEPTWIRLFSLLPLRGLLVSAELPNQAANNLLSVLNFNPSARWGFRFVWVIHLHESHAALFHPAQQIPGAGGWGLEGSRLRADTIGAFSETAAAGTQRSFRSGGS